MQKIIYETVSSFELT